MRLLRFDDDEAQRRTSTGVWVRRSVTAGLIVAALIATPWAYRSMRRSRMPASGQPFIENPPPTSPSASPAPATPTTPASTGPTGSSGSGAPDGRAYRPGLTALPDSNLSGPVSSSSTLTVRAMSREGRPLANRMVRFRVAAGSGTLDADSLTTDPEGLARAVLTLPSRPGRLLVTADLPGTDLPGARFSVVARSGPASRVSITGGDQQKGPPGQLLPERLGVRVTDRTGIPVRGIQVRFRTVGQGGMVAPSRTRTDSTGSAFAYWRLADGPGEQHVAALIPDVTDTFLTFTATALTPASAAPPAPAQQNPAPAEPDVPAPVTVAPRSFVVGGNFVCALRSGRVSCRGADDRGQSLTGQPTDFAALAAGVSHACGLMATGKAFCWGADDGGQLGDGSETDQSPPVAVSTSVLFSKLAAGVSHTCGLAAGGRAYCWGQNVNGQLGDGSRDDHPIPQPVSGGRNFTELVAGWTYTCGLSTRGQAFCWGLNDHGQLGDGTRLDRLVPTAVPGSFGSLVAGSAHTCGIRQGEAFCWGDNRFGQLGDGSMQDRARPQRVVNLPGGVTELAAGAVSTCALLRDGTVRCWGQNLHGELGDGTHENRSTPGPVAGSLKFRSIFAGGALTCGFTDDGVEYCWGLNQSGQLGDGTRASRSVPTRVGG